MIGFFDLVGGVIRFKLWVFFLKYLLFLKGFNGINNNKMMWKGWWLYDRFGSMVSISLIILFVIVIRFINIWIL